MKHNKIKSINVRGKRKPGRPFNTTTYPWRSSAIGTIFRLNNSHPPAGRMIAKLKAEGFEWRSILDEEGTIMLRIA
jgi:hypothetical protein